jgi:hypothetical protein
MPHNRPRVSAATTPSYGLIATTLAVMLGLGILVMRSGAIEALNASGFFGG